MRLFLGLVLTLATPALAQKVCSFANTPPGNVPNGVLLTSWFALPIQIQSPTILTAIDFYMSTNARFKGDANGRIAVWTSVNGLPGRVLGSASFVASEGVAGYYGAKFATPVPITQAGQYFVAFRNLDALVPLVARQGGATPYYYGPPRVSQWVGPVRGIRFIYRVYCGSHGGAWTEYGTAKRGSGGVAPRLRGLGQPNTSNTIHLQTSRGRGGGASVLLLGSRVSIPFPHGTLLATPIVSLAHVLAGNGDGRGHATVDLPLPNDARLKGVAVASQAWILDAAAQNGLAHSGGLEFRIGH